MTSVKTLEDVKRSHIEQTLNLLRWNISAAARALDINRRTCQRYIARYGLIRPTEATRRVVLGSAWRYVRHAQYLDDPIRIVSAIDENIINTTRSDGSRAGEWGSRDDFYSYHTHVSDPKEEG